MMKKKTKKPSLRCTCRVMAQSSRVCERGTRGCVVRHKQPKNLLPTLLPVEQIERDFYGGRKKDVERWRKEVEQWKIHQDDPEPLFGNHIRETWEAIKSYSTFFKPAGTVRFTKRSVKAYLDRCIVNW